MIRARRADQIRALARAIAVIRPENRRAVAVAPGQGIEILPDRINGAVIRIAIVRRVGILFGKLVRDGLEIFREALLGEVLVRQRGANAG